MQQPSLEDFSRVVTSIYDCALDPDKWQTVLSEVCALSLSASAGLHFFDSQTQQGVRGYQVGMEPAHLDTLVHTYGAMFSMLTQSYRQELGAPRRICDLVQEEEYLQSRFYREWAVPADQRDGLGMVALRSGNRTAMLTQSRRHADPLYTPADVQAAQLLAPHICRALMISDTLSLNTIRSNQLEQSLDALAAGVYLVGRTGTVLYMNGAAEFQIAEGSALTIVAGKLVPRLTTAQASLGAALQAAVYDEASGHMREHSLALPGVTGRHLISTILPLARGEREAVARPFSAVAAVFAQDAQTPVALPGAAFATLYQLTPAELKVALALIPGLGPQEIAAMLGVSVATVKSHLGRVFTKTGASRQADLVALILRGTPPVREVETGRRSDG
jgi:DNA-binding CsgD family transcriptional regulator/PAS domain-containing protein